MHALHPPLSSISFFIFVSMEFSALIQFFILLVTFYLQHTTSKSTHNNLTDLNSLLAFKAHITDPHGILADNWTTTTSFCSWIGVRCSPRHGQRVAAISLRSLSLQGTIAPHLGNLSFLSSIDLANNTLSGPIPASLGRLPRLASVVLEWNSLSGPIPPSFFNMSSLIKFYAASNDLSGSLPSNDSIMLPRLQIISVTNNGLTGVIPSSFARCRDLKVLSLSINRFSGHIPVELGILQGLIRLFLGENRLTGTIPASLGNLTSLNLLGLNANNITGSIPEELGGLLNLQGLYLTFNDLAGSIPLSLLNASQLFFVDLGYNRLGGSVPVDIGKSLPLLSWFNLGGNQLTGGLEFLSSLSNCRNLSHLEIWGNQFEGAIPFSVGNLSASLLNFYAEGNHISGNIPVGFGNLSSLVRLQLEMNELTGAIPSDFTRLQSLNLLSLGFNMIDGSIPPDLGLMRSLNLLDLRYNLLSGSVPESLANISRIQYLYLKSNKLSSSIPLSLWNLDSLLELDLSANTLIGSLPPHVANLKALISLNLSMNQLSSNISTALGQLQMLKVLDLSHNLFHDQIPQSFGGLISITYMNLSHNFLSGAIPSSLANLSYLDSLDLSFNELEGQIPKGRVFSNASIPSLIGNEALCGAPQLHILPCSDSPRRKLQSLKYIIPFTVLGVVLIACACVMYMFYSRRKAKASTPNDATSLLEQRAISHREIIRATANFSEENLLGRGSFGSVFKARLDDGSLVAVKVLNLDVEGASKSFDSECQVLRMVRHRNLIKIISVCSTLDFKALILQFMPNGNLGQWLHSNNSFLSLRQRLQVMVDVSLALEYLHHRHHVVVLHCDLKPENVLLDEEMVAHVSDFGIAKLLAGDGRSIASASMPGTIGYIAPEYASTGMVSRMGDVYSFGILLLETFTGRRPVDFTSGEELSSLREWVSNAHPFAISDVVDNNLLKDQDGSDGHNIELTSSHRCLASVIELGLTCSMPSPKERIPMEVVAARLQKIKQEFLPN